MTRRRVLIALAVAVAVLAEVGMVHGDVLESRSLWVMFLLAMFPSHGALLGFWAALGGKATPWRLVVVVLGMAAWLRWVEVASLPFTGATYWGSVGLLQIGLTSAMLFIGRLLGVELTDVPADGSVGASATGRPWVQFSLRSLLSWTTAVAVLLALLHYVPREGLDVVLEYPPYPAAILGGNASLVVGSMWLTLGTRRTTIRFAVLALLTVSAVALLRILFGGLSLQDTELFVKLCAGEVFWLVSSLWLVRLAGYRLVWRRRVAL